MPSTSQAASPSSASGLLLRPAAARFHTRLDWLDSHHSFSFGSHHDPVWMGYGPLRVINDDTIAPGRGFGLHPHRDMEIITVLVEGELEHRDSLGHGAMLRAGEVQRMTAGTGILHSEINTGSEPCRLLQIWIEPERRGLAPAYAQRPFSIGSGWTPLIEPEGRGDTLTIHRAVRLWRARPKSGVRLTLPLPEGQSGWLQLLDGAVRLAAAPDPLGWTDDPGAAGSGSLVLERGDGLGLAAVRSAGSLILEAGPRGADLLLFSFA